ARNTADDRRQDDDEREGDEGAPDDLEVIGERLEHQRGTSANTAAATRRRKRPKKIATPSRERWATSSSGSTSDQRCQRRAFRRCLNASTMRLTSSRTAGRLHRRARER